MRRLLPTWGLRAAKMLTPLVPGCYTGATLALVSWLLVGEAAMSQSPEEMSARHDATHLFEPGSLPGVGGLGQGFEGGDTVAAPVPAAGEHPAALRTLDCLPIS